MLRLHAGLYLS